MTTTEKGTTMRVPPSPDAPSPSERTPEATRVHHIDATPLDVGPLRTFVHRCIDCGAQSIGNAPEMPCPADDTPERVPVSSATVAALDLDALHETICDNFTGMTEVRQAADLLVAEVRRLTADLDMSERLLATMDHWAEVAETCERKANESHARRESAEAEVATLRARVAAVEALPDEWEGEADANETHPKECRTLLSAASQLRAALATAGSSTTASATVTASIAETPARRTTSTTPSMSSDARTPTRRQSAPS